MALILQAMQTIALDLRGELDATTVDAFREALRTAARTPRTRTVALLANLRAAEFGALIELARAVRALREDDACLVYIAAAGRRIGALLPYLNCDEALLPDAMLVCADQTVQITHSSSGSHAAAAAIA